VIGDAGYIGSHLVKAIVEQDQYVNILGDYASAHIQDMTCLNNGDPSGIFNLEIGNGYSLNEEIQSAVKVTGKDVPLTYKPK